jgi:transposase
MRIIGCDYHPGFQQIAFVDTDTGELQERRLQHSEEAEKFYRDLAAQGMKVRVGMEASGHARWFERLRGKQIASYLGLVPSEESSGDRRRLGHISKPGNTLLRFLLVEAAQVTVRSLPEWRSKYFHLAMRRGRKIAKVAMARKLAIQLYWMMRKEWEYEQVNRFGPHAGQPEHRVGVQQNTE